MSAVTTRRLVNPRAAASPSIYSRCECEFDTATICEFGNCRAIHSDSEPQPQPSSRIDWPSARSACSTVWRSASSSASCSVEAGSLVETRGIFAVRAEHVARRTPPALRNAGRWPRRYVRRWRAPPSRRRTTASLSASPLASRVAVREHSRWIAARMTRSGSGTRSAVPMIGDDSGSPCDRLPLSLVAAERTRWCATDSRGSARRASAASALPAAGCR